jgi:hypothetical protein
MAGKVYGIFYPVVKPKIFFLPGKLSKSLPRIDSLFSLPHGPEAFGLFYLCVLCDLCG